MQLTLLTGLLVFVFGLVTAAVADWGTTLYVLVGGLVLGAVGALVGAVVLWLKDVPSRWLWRLEGWLLGLALAAWVVYAVAVYPSVTFRVLGAASLTLFVLGVVWRVAGWARRPQPYVLVTTPGPTTRALPVLL